MRHFRNTTKVVPDALGGLFFELAELLNCPRSLLLGTFAGAFAKIAR